MRITFAHLTCTLSLGLFLSCSSSTRQHDEDAGADTDADQTSFCQPASSCEEPGFSDLELDIEADVVEVRGGQLVMLGDDNVPITFEGCGLELDAHLQPGQRVMVRNRPDEDQAGCWVGQVLVDGTPQLLSIYCEGDEPPTSLSVMGWSIELEPVCEGQVEQVCNASGTPSLLLVPETVYEAQITPGSGDSTSVPIGMMRVGTWQVHLIDARRTDEVDDGGCVLPATGTFIMVGAEASR